MKVVMEGLTSKRFTTNLAAASANGTYFAFKSSRHTPCAIRKLLQFAG